MNEQEFLKRITAFFRAQGFSVPSEPKTRRSDFSNNKEVKTEGLDIEWQYEPATGMAAFSQTQVSLRATVWVSNGKVNDQRFTLGVRYKHHEGGSNGFDRAFKVEHGCVVPWAPQ